MVTTASGAATVLPANGVHAVPTEIRIAGFGGQGILLMAGVIGKAAAIHSGVYATMTQNYGPEARGGASSAQLLLASEPVLYPYVTKPDVLVVMSQEAYTRFAPEIRMGGVLLVERDLVRVEDLPPGVRVHSIPATRLAEELGKRVVLNVVMTGFFAAVTGLLTPEAYCGAIADTVPARLRDLNLRAFHQGFDWGTRSTPNARSNSPDYGLPSQEVE
jgi:2-oxoglutarate ferredoxin oxidoreductase subunit gamma